MSILSLARQWTQEDEEEVEREKRRRGKSSSGADPDSDDSPAPTGAPSSDSSSSDAFQGITRLFPSFSKAQLSFFLQQAMISLCLHTSLLTVISVFHPHPVSISPFSSPLCPDRKQAAGMFAGLL